MNFRNLACRHLSQYKVDVLGVSENGIFHYRGRDIPKTHILPINDRDQNILKKYRDHFFSSDYAQIKFHQFFHHLNSSQALCINLFYPLIAENALDLFLKYLGVASNSEIRSLFEKESEIEKAVRSTSFDFYIQLAKTSKFFVEVKYTEDGFGKAKNADEHRHKFHKTYLPLLIDKSAFLVSECQDEALFLSHYQILRNLVHINDTDHVVLLFPSSNSAVAEESIYARDQLLTATGSDKLKIVFLDEFISFLENKCTDSPLDGYYQEFRAKYLPSGGYEDQ